MSKYKFTKTPIEGLLIIEPTVVKDKKGMVYESFSTRDFLGEGMEVDFIQESHTKLARGVLSGLHFQEEEPQAKLVRVTSGSILAVAVDMRPESFTYGASHSVELSAENCRLFYIPTHFAFGFLTLEQGSEIVCKSTQYENPKSQRGIIWKDDILAINWQFERYDIDEKHLNLTDKDKKLPSFRQIDPRTLWKQK